MGWGPPSYTSTILCHAMPIFQKYICALFLTFISSCNMHTGRLMAPKVHCCLYLVILWHCLWNPNFNQSSVSYLMLSSNFSQIPPRIHEILCEKWLRWTDGQSKIINYLKVLEAWKRCTCFFPSFKPKSIQGVSHFTEQLHYVYILYEELWWP